MAIRRSVTSLATALLAIVLLASCGGNAPSPTPTAAQETATPVALATLHLSVFQSPTRNIGCAIIESNVRCDIRLHTFTPPAKPADCDLEWGDAIELNETGGAASFLCHGDTAFDTRSPVLRYGERTRVGKIVCLSSKGGVVCAVLGTRHSFALSRARYALV